MKNLKSLQFSILLILMLATCALPAVAQLAPSLGSAGNFALFTASGAVTNTGNSFITGSVGTNTGAITGFGNVNGVMHTSDGITGAATTDLQLAYNNLNSTVSTSNHAALLGNETLFAGVYAIAGNATLDGSLTLDANNDPNAVFIFKMDAAFSTSVASQIILINGAMACNIFWKVEGLVSIGSQTIMRGTVIANNAAIDLGSDVFVDGRILSTTGAITLLNSSAKVPPGCGRPVLTGPAAPNLKSAECYAIFTSIGEVTNNGITTVTGDIGTNSGLTTGYNPLIVNGAIHPLPDASTAAAAADLVDAYNELNTLPYDIELLYPAQFGNDLVLTPHTYLMNAATSLTGNVILNAEGNPDAIFVIQINGALSTSTFASILLTNGTQAKNVYWKVDGAVNIADYAEFKGTVIANNGAISLATGAEVEGSILTTGGLVTTNAAKVTGNAVCSPLPLTWLYFRAKEVNQQIVLEWATQNEENVAYFTIEKSKDAKSFTELTSVKAEGKENKEMNFYTYIDESPFASNYYRIVQTDLDGRKNWFTVLNIILGKNKEVTTTHYTKGKTIFINTSGETPGNGLIELYSMDGKKIVSKKIQFSNEQATYQINHNLNKGIFILIIKSQSGIIHKGKVVIY